MSHLHPLRLLASAVWLITLALTSLGIFGVVFGILSSMSHGPGNRLLGIVTGDDLVSFGLLAMLTAFIGLCVTYGLHRAIAQRKPRYGY
jgi:Kef-type K+ transport system membrane component KefB